MSTHVTAKDDAALALQIINQLKPILVHFGPSASRLLPLIVGHFCGATGIPEKTCLQSTFLGHQMGVEGHQLSSTIEALHQNKELVSFSESTSEEAIILGRILLREFSVVLKSISEGKLRNLSTDVLLDALAYMFVVFIKSLGVPLSQVVSRFGAVSIVVEEQLQRKQKTEQTSN